MTHRMRLLLRNARQIVQVVGHKESRILGPIRAGGLKILESADDGHSVVIDCLGNIEMIGTSRAVDQVATQKGWVFDHVLDCSGKVLLPGFVDAHTHPVWAGDRSHEFVMKLAGATYLEVQRAGGGIGFTTKCTREATEEELLTLLVARLDRMKRHGTTTVEGKSGYGLNVESECKMLRVLHEADLVHPLSVISTFCGAHAVPTGSTSEEATTDVIERQLPAVLKEKELGKNNVSAIDVFCETGVFSHAEARRILLAGKAAGLRMNFHGDELSFTASGELAAEVGAHAVAHLEHVSDEGIAQMASRDVTAVLLPATAYVLRIAPPPARKLIDGGVAVALGSDFCPNAHILSMPMTMNLACVLMRMSVEEALAGATINAAFSLGVSTKCGSLEEGKWGDVVVLDAPKWEHIVYDMVDPPISHVIKLGHVIFATQTA